MGILKNPKEEAYCQARILGSSQRKAYKAAFPASIRWKPETVDSKASHLEATDKVKARLSELQREAVKQTLLTREQRQQLLCKIALNSAAKDRDRISALDILNKMDGDYVTKFEVNTPVTTVLEEMDEYFDRKKKTDT